MHFNPCGKAVATMRRGYVTDCRFFADSDTVLRIRWYRCNPGAPTLGVSTPITPNGWKRKPWAAPKIGEVYGGYWKYTPGIPIPDARGLKICGDLDDFKNGGEYDPLAPPTIYRPDGLPVCCAPLRTGIELGGHGIAVQLGGGVKLAGDARREQFAAIFNVIAGSFNNTLDYPVNPGNGFWETFFGEYASMTATWTGTVWHWRFEIPGRGWVFELDGYDGIPPAYFPNTVPGGLPPAYVH